METRKYVCVRWKNKIKMSPEKTLWKNCICFNYIKLNNIIILNINIMKLNSHKFANRQEVGFLKNFISNSTNQTNNLLLASK